MKQLNEKEIDDIRAIRATLAKFLPENQTEGVPHDGETWWCDGLSYGGTKIKGFCEIICGTPDQDWYIKVKEADGSVWSVKLKVAKHQRPDAPKPAPHVFEPGDIRYLKNRNPAQIEYIESSGSMVIYANGLREYWSNHAVADSTIASQSQVLKFMDERYMVVLDEVRCRFYEHEHIIGKYEGQEDNAIWSQRDLSTKAEKALLAEAGVNVMSWADCQRYQDGKFEYPMEATSGD